jgi:DsbC/DsbD-like thiol-disulfide interchange protein
VKTDRGEVAPGETFEVLVRVRIAAGHHIYAATPKSKAFTGTRVSLVLPSGVEAVSGWSEPAAVQARDGEMVYTNSVSYSRTFKLGSATVASPILLKGKLRYQACNDQLCWPPKTIPFSATLTVQQLSRGTP